MKIKYHQKFYQIGHHRFSRKIDGCGVCLRHCECEKNQWYVNIEPVYVYQKNVLWNGKETFDIGPVNFGLKKNAKESWRWKREQCVDDIGESIFVTKKQAQTAFRKKFTDRQRKIFAKLELAHKKQQKLNT